MNNGEEYATLDAYLREHSSLSVDDIIEHNRKGHMLFIDSYLQETFNVILSNDAILQACDLIANHICSLKTAGKYSKLLSTCKADPVLSDIYEYMYETRIYRCLNGSPRVQTPEQLTVFRRRFQYFLRGHANE